jgi:hypothetical protein
MVEMLRRDIEAAGIDPEGLDLATLARIRIETEQRIAAHRIEQGFEKAPPAFAPPTDPP